MHYLPLLARRRGGFRRLRQLAVLSLLLSVPLIYVLYPGGRSAGAAVAPTELFISEYIEGSSNNKALEIYNGTGADIDLGAGGYNVQMFFNGNPAAGLTINLTGTVTAGDVFVLAQSLADAAILAQADQLNGAGWFNGDDAVVLRKGATVIDSIGQAGFDPGTEWGSGLISTADNTLRRKASVEQGDTVPTDAFDPSVEWDGFATNTFGDLGCHLCPTPPPTLAEIFEIQGSGLASPYVGQAVQTFDNVVTAVGPNGFFIQTPDARADADPETSNGLFVFTGGAPTVQVGDQVDITASVVEFFNLTELGGPTVTVDSTGNPLPTVIMLDAATPSPNQPQPANELERFEGMLVRVENALATGPTDRFGDTPIVAGTQRAFREPGILFPGLPGLPVWDGNPEVFEINADQLGLPRVEIPAGALIEVAQGPLSFDFGDYQIWPTALSVTGEPSIRAVRARNACEFTVATQNLLRLFDTVNDPAVDDDVLTPAQYATRLNKVSLLIRGGLDTPDVLAVQEVENLGVLQDVANKVNADAVAAGAASPNYQAYLLEGNDIGGIDVGFLVRDTVTVTSVTQFGKDDTFTFEGATAILNDRPPLVLQGAYVGGPGEEGSFPIMVIAVHQRSLSGIEGSDGPRVRAKRHEQALRLSQYVQSLQVADPDVRLVGLGDFNAFEFTDGYVDVMGQVTGNPDPAGALVPATDEVNPDLTNQTFNLPTGERYSFVFEGSAQSLDHVLTSLGLDPLVRGVEHFRGNADAPASFEVVAGTALRTADHDGTVLYIFADITAPVITPAAGPFTIFPPDHRYRTFAVADLVESVSDGCDTGVGVGDVVMTRVVSDELEDAPGKSDGSTLNDIVIAPDCKSVRLRGERDGRGDGRVYTITLQVSDAQGNVGTATVTVAVPLSPGEGGAEPGPGAAYTVTGSCPP